MKSDTTPNKMSKAFWIYTGILIGTICIICLVFLVYVICCSVNTNLASTPCNPFTAGNWFDLFVGLAGLGLAILLTWLVIKKGWIGENYCVALLAFLGFIMYGLVTYDIKKQECKAIERCSSLNTDQIKTQEPATQNAPSNDQK